MLPYSHNCDYNKSGSEDLHQPYLLQPRHKLLRRHLQWQVDSAVVAGCFKLMPFPGVAALRPTGIKCLLLMCCTWSPTVVM